MHYILLQSSELNSDVQCDRHIMINPSTELQFNA